MDIRNITFAWGLPCLIPTRNQQGKINNYVVVYHGEYRGIYSNKNKYDNTDSYVIIDINDLQWIKHIEDLNPESPLGKYILEVVGECKHTK